VAAAGLGPGHSAYGFDTLQVHAGYEPDPATGSRQVPIYQTTAFQFRDADHAAALFNLQEVGYIYSRLTNPTVAALANRIAALEGGAGAVCTSSGHAAQIMALYPLMAPGLNIVASTRLYGGTFTQFTHVFRRFGWETKWVDFDDPDAVAAAVDDNTRAIYCESLANPAGVHRPTCRRSPRWPMRPGCRWWSTTPRPHPTCAGRSRWARLW
jgi:O-acetylhomoserine (thiol)-lyase